MTNQPELPGYYANIDSYGLSAETMTDGGIPMSAVQPIDECTLTPGDPSPCGRTVDGDLVYPILPKDTHLRLRRQDLAWLAYLVARDQAIRRIPEPPFHNPDVQLFMQLLGEALPEELFEDSAHGRLARQQGLDAILEGRMDRLPPVILGKDPE